MKSFTELFEDIFSRSGKETSETERQRDKARRSLGIRVTRGSRGNISDLFKASRKRSKRGKSVHKSRKNVFKNK